MEIPSSLRDSLVSSTLTDYVPSSQKPRNFRPNQIGPSIKNALGKLNPFGESTEKTRLRFFVALFEQKIEIGQWKNDAYSSRYFSIHPHSISQLTCPINDITEVKKDLTNSDLNNIINSLSSNEKEIVLDNIQNYFLWQKNQNCLKTQSVCEDLITLFYDNKNFSNLAYEALDTVRVQRKDKINNIKQLKATVKQQIEKNNNLPITQLIAPEQPSGSSITNSALSIGGGQAVRNIAQSGGDILGVGWCLFWSPITVPVIATASVIDGLNNPYSSPKSELSKNIPVSKTLKKVGGSVVSLASAGIIGKNPASIIQIPNEMKGYYDDTNYSYTYRRFFNGIIEYDYERLNGIPDSTYRENLTQELIRSELSHKIRDLSEDARLIVISRIKERFLNIKNGNGTRARKSMGFVHKELCDEFRNNDFANLVTEALNQARMEQNETTFKSE